jgi:hypothetical protein
MSYGTNYSICQVNTAELSYPAPLLAVPSSYPKQIQTTLEIPLSEWYAVLTTMNLTLESLKAAQKPSSSLYSFL